MRLGEVYSRPRTFGAIIRRRSFILCLSGGFFGGEKPTWNQYVLFWILITLAFW